MMLIVRREQGKLVRYVHLGTGNYHYYNARQYADFSLFTANPEMTLDAHYVFQQLTGMGRASKLKKMVQAPFMLHKTLLALIEKEIAYAREKKPAKIYLKLNALTENSMIAALYRASQAGVEVKLIVRGMCCLRPGVAGVSDNINVYSLVGRYLEHGRAYYFYQNGEEKVYLSSADWMERNLFHRVEICFPIEEVTLKKRILKEAFEYIFKDNLYCWQLKEDEQYIKVQPKKNEKLFSGQETLLAAYQTQG